MDGNLKTPLGPKQIQKWPISLFLLLYDYFLKIIDISKKHLEITQNKPVPLMLQTGKRRVQDTG